MWTSSAPSAHTRNVSAASARSPRRLTDSRLVDVDAGTVFAHPRRIVLAQTFVAGVLDAGGFPGLDAGSGDDRPAARRGLAMVACAAAVIVGVAVLARRVKDPADGQRRTV